MQPFFVCYGEDWFLIILCRTDSIDEHQPLAGNVEGTVCVGIVWKTWATRSAVVEVPLCVCYRRKDIVNFRIDVAVAQLKRQFQQGQQGWLIYIFAIEEVLLRLNQDGCKQIAAIVDAVRIEQLLELFCEHDFLAVPFAVLLRVAEGADASSVRADNPILARGLCFGVECRIVLDVELEVVSFGIVANVFKLSYQVSCGLNAFVLRVDEVESSGKNPPLL